MKIIFAPDKFKSCMTAPEVCAELERAFREVFPEAQLVSLPMADGGDGTMEAMLAAAGGERKTVTVTGPLGTPVQASFAMLSSGTAVLEMASASGIALLKGQELDPLRATTRGTGELIKAALDCSAKEIILGIGGSATTDGGAGMAQALGFRLLDAAGRDLEPGGGALDKLASIDVSQADPRLPHVTFRVACDVTNPLLGPRGAARVFAPQKGASPACVELLERNLTHLADVWKETGLLASTDRPGDGAAGGLGAGLRAFCHAESESGAQLVMKTLGFSAHLKGASLVVTGEGRTDSQTESGKICSEIAREAHAHGVPVMLLSGALENAGAGLDALFDFVFSISPGRTSLDDALKNGRHDLYECARNIARLARRAKDIFK